MCVCVSKYYNALHCGYMHEFPLVGGGGVTADAEVKVFSAKNPEQWKVLPSSRTNKVTCIWVTLLTRLGVWILWLCALTAVSTGVNTVVMCMNTAVTIHAWMVCYVHEYCTYVREYFSYVHEYCCCMRGCCGYRREYCGYMHRYCSYQNMHVTAVYMHEYCSYMHEYCD